ncbi:2-nitropropane dioxygenase-like enzyme [Mycolicibacterium chubuense NBB4]|uniref:Propionate 3-nitronate monooxygenase n=1 Tax=Mycolicibacterium chubuense (strain NBB4) TaxID=710421 RepID=I4BMM9_MYCCN|nr:nitronate monooxygenase [Mycolicibacterium chubuense]AFM18536.1 2-nitropropane dioxygenase-like enzyme [Mycolicibacterium chubuense NBB4]
MPFDLRDLSAPILAAPMAGGPSTPELAAAATDAGGLGFVAAGYLTAEVFAQRLEAARRLTSGPLAANLFAPQPSAGTAAAVAAYADTLAGEAQRYDVALGEPRVDDDGWDAKIDVLLAVRPELVSFTFGLPSADERRRLSDAGIVTAGTVTTLDEARMAADVGVELLVAQGPSAGGHRGTFDATARPSEQLLDDLLDSITSGLDLPVVAAGGLMTAADVRRVRQKGAVAAQLGTAFLLSDEAGSSAVHRSALQDPQFTETIVTKAFSGRYARGLRNRFVDEHDDAAPLAYPQVHYLTSPLRAASVRAGDPHGVNIWAGTGFRRAEAAPAATIISKLADG